MTRDGATLYFVGRFQCRLATDPDPFDEPFGLRGNTFALPGEPPFDRVIRTGEQNTVRRLFCPPIGVFVCRIDNGSTPMAAYLGARVELNPQTTQGGPFFESWNRLRARERKEPVLPIALTVAATSGKCISRQLTDSTPKPVADVPRDLADFAEAYVDPKARLEPREQYGLRGVMLQELLTKEQDASTRRILRARISALEKTDSERYRTPMHFAVELNSRRLEGADADALNYDKPWPLHLAFSRWDFDSMSGVLAGKLTVFESGSR